MAAREPFDTLTLYAIDPLTPVSLQRADGALYAAVRHAGCAVKLLTIRGSSLHDMLDAEIGAVTTGLWEVVEPGPRRECRSCDKTFMVEVADG